MCWNDIKYFVVLLCCLSCAVSCHTENGNPCEVDGIRELEVGLAVSGAGNAGVRSILDEETIETKVTDATVASYDSDGVLVSVLYYDNPEGLLKSYVKGLNSNTVYVLANMGDMSEAFPDNEDEVADMKYMLGSYDEVVVKGIPMCGILKDCSYVEGRSYVVQLERLFAKVKVRILHTGLSGSSANSVTAYNLANKSVYIRQANRRLMPFSPEGSRAGKKTDVLEQSDCNPDLADRNAYEGSLSPSEFGPGLAYFQDTTVVLYVPENVQGILLPANSDPLAKTAENISGPDGNAYGGLCTYLEFNAAKPDKGDGFWGDIMYRCYLGDDNHSDFSIRRNACYDLTMNFTDGGFMLDNWKVVRGENWTDVRTLCFMDAPFVIYPGTAGNVLVHYNRFSTSMTAGSNGPVSDFVYEFDEVAMARAGVTCTFMGSAKTESNSGSKEFYFRVEASKDAPAGSSFPISVALADGTKSDASVVFVSAIGTLTPVWEFRPEYVSQTGSLRLGGVVEELLPLTASVSDDSVLNCVKTGDDTFEVTVTGKGKSDIVISNADGSQTLTLSLDTKAPKLSVSDIYIALAPDGEPGYLDYYYVDDDGVPITHVSAEVYERCLRPVVKGCDYLTCIPDDTSMKLYISRLYESGKLIGMGKYYDLSVSASGCPDAGTHSMRAYVVDPFNGMPSFATKMIDDYTLFALPGIPDKVRSEFSDEYSSWSDIRYEIPPVDADITYVSSSLEPAWKNVFSNENGVFRSDYDHSDSKSAFGASVTVGRNYVNSSTSHGAGRHDLKLNVTNRHSGEMVSHTLGILDVYVHTAIGAEASFGSLVCSYPSGGTYPASSVAEIYNSISVVPFYSPTSSAKIYYADVSMKYLTDVSRVFVFSEMERGNSSYQNVMNSMDIVRPSVGDGETDTSLRLLYSVNVGSDQRTAVCGETYGMRKGIGPMLYRALSMETYTTTLTNKELNVRFLGYSDLQLGGLGTYAPCYTMHDMNKGSDMTANTVSKTSPYYFSPTSCSLYRDSSGRGYHVIHTLNAIAPYTCGWINLL